MRTSHAYLEKIASGNAAPSMDMLDRLPEGGLSRDLRGRPTIWFEGRQRRSRKCNA